MTEQPSLQEQLSDLREIKQLMQLLELMMSMNEARYFLERMKRTKFEETMDSIYETDGNLLAFVIAYGRGFMSAGPGRTVLKPAQVYGTHAKLTEMHEEIMHFRNRKHAHHEDNMLTTVVGCEVSFQEGGDLLLVPQVQLGLPLDSYARYDPVLRRMDQYLYDRQKELLDRASEKIGRKIVMPDGPTPPWASDGRGGDK
ncbi:Hypothetical protein NGAL_HAMBI2605_62750 [Neorhizobium galegae bv. orientalis]|nr:Hypothetical protein NGAL_HAMBI2605_62750 [Neorhizobium galegae bv. orientalis]